MLLIVLKNCELNGTEEIGAITPSQFLAHPGMIIDACILRIQLSLLITHLPLDKMAAILVDNIFKCIFLNENDRIPIQI